MNKGQVVFFVSSPMQYYNALEYVFQLPQNDLHIVLIQGVLDSSIIASIDEMFLTKSVWNERYTIDYKKFKNLGSPWSRRKLYQFAKRIIISGNTKKIIIGNYGLDVFYNLLLTFKNKDIEFVALDDGIPTITILNSRKNRMDFKNYHRIKLYKQFKYILAFNRIILFSKIIERVTFFTIYYNLQGGVNDEIIENKNTRLKKLYATKAIQKNMIYFIGSTYSRRNLIHPKEYLNYLIRVKQYYASQGKQVIYIRHRNELDKDLLEIEKLFEIKQFRLPVELELGTQDSLPFELSTFFSSALFTLNMLLPKDVSITSFEFNFDHLSGSEHESIQHIQNTYESIKKTPDINFVPYNQYC